MSAKSKIRSGFLIIADISGYTSFVSGTELEHAQSIIEELTKLILGHIGIFEFIPVDADHTKISMRVRSLPRGWFTMLLIRLFMKRSLDKENVSGFNKLEKLLLELDNNNKE